MANGIRTGDPRGFNKGRSSKIREDSLVRQTPEIGRRTYRPKRCGNNNNDEDNSPKTFNDKNHQASSHEFRQIKKKLCREALRVSSLTIVFVFYTQYKAWYVCNVIIKSRPKYPFSNIIKIITEISSTMSMVKIRFEI